MRGIKPLLALAVLSLLGPAVASAVTYTGSLDYSPFSYHDDLRIHGRQWPWYDLEFSWNVTDEDASHPAFPWRYDYRLKVRNPWPWGSLKGPINYVIIELSPGVTMDDMGGEAVTAGMGDAGIRVPEHLDSGAPQTFPNVPPSAVPVRRLGFDIDRLVDKAIGLIDRQRREGAAATATALDAEFETTG